VTYLERVVALTPETPEASTVPKPIGRPDGPGLWHHKHWMLPPYIQHVAHALMRHGHGEEDAIHMAVGIVKNWAKGHDGKGHRTHPDVRAAAAANVARWEELRAHAHAATAAKHAAHGDKKEDHGLAATGILDLLEEIALASGPTIYKSSFLQKGTAPGAKTLTGQQLYQVPSQTVAAGPPLPPGVALPTPAELNALAAAIDRAPPVPDKGLVKGAAAQARVAAMKMTANQPIDALHCLRSAQAGIVSAHRSYNASLIPVANVFAATLDPQAAAAARERMLAGIRSRESFRTLASQTAQCIDRIRRHYFHGMYNHMADTRFTAEEQ
jgi:hypothetical protein